jgi:hypothetical protein
MPQPWIERANRGENARRAAAILNIGFMHERDPRGFLACR